ncbi:MAG TPA: hypothetical protein VMH77_01245 [Steroidobacteraceae bacterium]|nr:hypothetical protein [Steroidobacteraceae bacterium]
MRRQWLLATVLLCPAFAGAQSAVFAGGQSPATAAAQALYYSNFDGHRIWVGVGVGNGTVESAAPAPAAGLSAFAGSIDAGYRITREWGLGIDVGVIAPLGGCGGHQCSPAQYDFAPDFAHWFLLSEYRPGGGWRLRAGAGISSMCYHYYKGSAPSWEYVVAVLLDDSDYDPDAPQWRCNSLSAFGASASIGYQWRIGRDSPASVGLQLRGEMADFAASSNAGTPAFRHRAVTLQMQFAFN